MATALGLYQPTWIERAKLPAWQRLSGQAKTVWSALVECAGFSRSGWRGSLKRIADRLRDIGHAIAWRTVRRAVGELVAAGFLAVRDSTHRMSVFAAVRSDAAKTKAPKPKAPPRAKTAEDVDLSGPMDRDGNAIMPRREVDKRRGVLREQIEWLAAKLAGKPAIPRSDADAEPMSDDDVKARREALLEQARRLAEGGER